jgi:hypothetical protein
MAPPLPKNLEAERAVLGTILRDNTQLAQVREILRPEDFCSDKNAFLFRTMLGFADDDRPIDLITITDHLDAQEEIGKAGGAAYIASLTDGLYKVSNVVDYALIVKEKAIKRDVIHATDAVQHNAFNGEPAEAVVKSAKARIAAIEKNLPQQDEIRTLTAAVEPLLLKDIPETMLDGWLGEVCQKRLGDLPRAYAWLALLAVASAFLNEQKAVRTNLYLGLVGPTHSGKSQGIDRAIATLGLESPQLLDIFAGSAEQLVRKCSDAAGNPRLFHPDELGHLFKKAQIDRSSFPFILNRAFYKDKFEVLMGAKQRAEFDCRLSIVGGLVEETFQDLFGKETVAGLYDRFLFGLCPGGFQYHFTPFRGDPERFKIEAVTIEESVWEAKHDYQTRHPKMNPRLLEVSIRTAVICAAFNGNRVLKGFQLEPAFELAEYQMNIRDILKANPGETIEGRVASKILGYLDRYAGKWVSWRILRRDTRLYDLGPVITDRVCSVLKANGDIEMTKIGKQTVIRRVLDSETEPEGTET